ncbi:hypothetical protein ACT691_11215 [Vibrio metschnikovii]
MGLFVLPIAWIGQALLPNAPADTLVLSIPMHVGAEQIALLAF